MKKIFLFIFTVFFIPLYAEATVAKTLTLTGTLRDFNQSHVDFEPHMDWENGLYPFDLFYDGKRGGHIKGYVLDTLDKDRKPVVNPNSHHTFTPKHLYQWYHDVSGVNMSMPYSIELKDIGGGLYQFHSNAFFPADGKLFGKEVYHGKTDSAYQHNFHLTYELHTQFTYKKGQIFNFVGDDDVWVFINNRLVVDLGGLHVSEWGSVKLDEVANDLGLVEGQVYNFDFFWAERHTTGSNFTITTSIVMKNSVDWRLDAGTGDAEDYEANSTIHVENDRFTLSTFLIDYNATLHNYHPNSSDPVGMPVLFYLKEKDRTIRIEDAVSKFSAGNNRATTNSIESAKIPDGKYEIALKYLDFYDTSKVNIKACTDKEREGTLKGFPQCVSENNKYKEIFGQAAYDRCVRSDATGQPCYLKNGGEGKKPYDHPYGCYECTIDTLWNNAPFDTTAHLEKVTLPEPYAEYRFDACSYAGVQDEVKDVKNRINGIARNGVVSSRDGKIKRSVYIDTERYIDLGDSFNEIFGETNDRFTITAWIKPSQLTNAQTNHKTKNTFIAKASDPKNDNIEIGVNPDGTLHLYLDTKKKDKYANIGSGIDKNKWHFVAVSYDGSTVRVNIDGNRFENKTTWKNGGNIDNAAGSPFTIGASLHVDNFFHGKVDEVKIFDRVLSDADIDAIYLRDQKSDGSDRVAQTCLIGEYRFDACEWVERKNVVKDSVGENHAKQFHTHPSEDAVIERAAALNDGVIETDIDYTFKNKPFAIAFWMKLHTLPDAPWMAILGKDFDLYVQKNGKLYVDPQNGSNGLISRDSLEVRKWHYVTVSSDAKKVTLYIDGKDNGSIDAADFGKNGNTLLMLGKTVRSEGSDSRDIENFNGLIDEMKIFDGVIDRDKIEKLIAMDNAGKNYDGSDRQPLRCLTPVGCTSKAIVIDDTKFVHQIDLVTGDKNTTVMNDEQIGGVSVNGFGYNVKDGFLWGSYNPGKGGYLVKIGKDENGAFAQKRVGPIEGLPTKKGTYIGDVDHNGMLYLYYKNTPSNGVHTMYVVDLNRQSADYLKVTEHYTLTGISIADMAFNPIDRQLYAIENDNDLYKIDVNNHTVHLIKKRAVDASNDVFGSSFFDSQGFFYAIKNRSRKIYRIDISDQNNIRSLIFSTLVNENVKNVNIDGGRCNLKPIYIDYGDAPDGSSYSQGDGTTVLNYKTLTSDDGPRHKLPEDESHPNVYLGRRVSSESDAKSGTESYNYDNDDGIADSIKPLLTNMYRYTIDLSVRNDTNRTANLVGWIDFNRNGRFETKEGVKRELAPNSAGVVALKWNVPDDIEKGTTYMRFRVTTDMLDTNESYSYGPKSDGEVEDWQITIKEGTLYDVWDSDSSIDKRIIKTKKVNEGFPLVVASFDRSGHLKKSTGSDIKIRIVSKDTGHILQDYMDVNLSDNYLVAVQIPDINESSRESVVQIKYTDELNVTHEVNATDNFAVRPDKFTIHIPDDLVAGKEFNVTLSALGAKGEIVKNYNDDNHTVLDINETKSGCRLGKIVGGDRIEFKNGQATLSFSYDDVGKLKFALYEKEGNEFAKIDQDDTADSRRFITKEEKISREFKPAKMRMIWELKNGDPQNGYTCFSSYDHNDPALETMSARLKIHLEIQNAKGDFVKNFSDACYAYDVPVKISYTVSGEDSLKNYTMLSAYQDKNGTYYDDLASFDQDIISGVKQVQSYQIDKKLFHEGNGTKIMTFNFKRNTSVPREPMTFTINDLNATLGKIENYQDNAKKVTFFYTRVHIPDQNIIGKEGNATVYYEVYCKNCNRGNFGLDLLPESKDSIHWYILNNITTTAALDFTLPVASTLWDRGFMMEKSGNSLLKIQVEKAPSTVRVKYKPKKYLVFNRFNPAAETHSFTASFHSGKKSWAGQGSVGYMVDTTISPRNNVDIIDW